jgi:hypothetical protein
LATGNTRRETAGDMTTLLLSIALVFPLLMMPLESQSLPRRPSLDVTKERLQAVARARTQLSVKLNIEQGDIDVESAKPATWPNSALGCPERGRMYAQVVTDGWVVRLKAKGDVHEVHVSGRRAVVCPRQQPGGEPPPR